MTDFGYGKLAYEAYCEATELKEPQSFESLGDSYQRIWIHVASVVRSS